MPAALMIFAYSARSSLITCANGREFCSDGATHDTAAQHHNAARRHAGHATQQDAACDKAGGEDGEAGGVAHLEGFP